MSPPKIHSLPASFAKNAEDRTTFLPLLIWKRLAPGPDTKMPNWVCIRLLGGGQFNDGVYLMRNRETGIYYAKKTVEEELRQKGHYYTELDVLDQIKGHPNITTLWRGEYEYDQTGEYTAYLGIQWCDLGTLHDFIQRAARQQTIIPPNLILKVIQDLSSALAYLHSGYDLSKPNHRAAARAGIRRKWNAIAHRDIKADNIFIQSVSGSGLPTVVLGDFGHATSQKLLKELRDVLPQMHGHRFPTRHSIFCNMFFADIQMTGNMIADLGVGAGAEGARRYGLHFTKLPSWITDLVRQMIDGTNDGYLDAFQVYEYTQELQSFLENRGGGSTLPSSLMPPWTERQPWVRQFGTANAPLEDIHGVYAHTSRYNGRAFDDPVRSDNYTDFRNGDVGRGGGFAGAHNGDPGLPVRSRRPLPPPMRDYVPQAGLPLR